MKYTTLLFLLVTAVSQAFASSVKIRAVCDAVGRNISPDSSHTAGDFRGSPYLINYSLFIKYNNPGLEEGQLNYLMSLNTLSDAYNLHPLATEKESTLLLLEQLQ